MRETLVNIRMVIVTIFVGINFAACDKYDDEELWNKVNELENRMDILESKVNNLNSEISSIQELYEALHERLYVTNVENTTDGTKITFSDKTTITVTNGKNGSAPIINAALHEGIYYWTQTINGDTSWVTDTNGNKIPTTGANGVTPLLKVSSDGYWMISYNNENSYSYITDSNNNYIKAVGTDGKDEESFFSSVEIKNSQLIITLPDSSIIILPLENFTGMRIGVDMGLSVKWSAMNIGAEATHEIGTYSLWGDGTGILDPDYINFSNSTNKTYYDNITATNRDLAHMKWGSGWRIPTYFEFLELASNSSYSTVVVNGATCLKLTSNKNGNHIIMPINGGLYPQSIVSGVYKYGIMEEGISCYYMTSKAYEDSSTSHLFAYFFSYSTSEKNWRFPSFLVEALKVGIRPVID